MTTNKEWLFSLPLEEQYAWMNAERTESPTSATMQHIGQVIEGTVKRGVYGDTDTQDADSREKLEADIGLLIADYMPTEDSPQMFSMICSFIDRQAAITERERRKPNWDYCETCETLAELTAERDELQERLNRTTAAMNRAAGKWARANEQCNEYREKFSKCLDYADAIHALMDDEGMA